MKAGLICGEGSPGKLLTDENLSQLYDMPLSEVKKRRGKSISV
jgi:ABC-type enterochelin transport system ATPase subunit